MPTATSDRSVLHHIEQLAGEEHRLFEKRDLTDEERARLARIGVELDQYWDLLRQRRARREFGQDPDTAEIRPPGVVEKYEG